LLQSNNVPNVIDTGGQTAYLFVVTFMRNVSNVPVVYSWGNATLTPTPTPSPPPAATAITGSFVVPNNARDAMSIELRSNLTATGLVDTVIVPIPQGQAGQYINFAFADIAPGTYSLVFNLPGFTTFTINNVIAAEGADIDLNQDPRFNPNLPISPGDINGDGQINIEDLQILLANWMTDYANADLGGNGQVGILSLNILLQNWMATAVVID